MREVLDPTPKAPKAGTLEASIADLQNQTIADKATEAASRAANKATDVANTATYNAVNNLVTGSANLPETPLPKPVTKKVIGTQMVEKNGHQVMVTTFDDGTTSEQDYGLSAATQRQNQNWLQVGQDLLNQYGVGSLWKDYSDLILNKGYDNATAMLAIQSLPAWKARFSANEVRLKQGLPVLDPRTYLDTEAAYKQVMIAAGLPSSLYNDTSKLGDLMAKDISPLELKMRTDAAHVAIDEQDPYVLDQLKTRFGLDRGDIVLHMLDPNTAASVINAKVASARIGAEASRVGFGGVSTAQDDALAAAGVTQSQANQGFNNLTQMAQFGQALPGDESGSVSQQQMIDSQFGLSGAAATALKAVQQKRLATFQESGGLAAGAGGVSGAGSANLAS